MMSEPALPAVLAIDGGNSKTDVALVAADGRVLAAVRGGGSNHQVIGQAAMVIVLTELVRAAADAAGVPAGGPVAAHTSACLAGADLADEEAELGELITGFGWSATVSVVNDTFAVLRAGLDDAGPGRAGTRAPGASRHWGIGVVCGAGINCVGVGPDGRTTRFLALGRVSGDWGGGGDLGPEALWWAARDEDGRGARTELRTAVPAHFGLERVEDVTIGLYRGKIDYSELHGLVPLLFEVAGRGDAVARDVVLRQADEVCVMVLAAARKLDLVGGPAVIPVVLGGGLMTARDPLLWGTIRERLRTGLPGADVRIVEVPPVGGAALLGLDRAGVPASALARLRESVSTAW